MFSLIIAIILNILIITISYISVSIFKKYQKVLIFKSPREVKVYLDEFEKRQTDYTASWDISEESISVMEDLFPSKPKNWIKNKKEKITSDYSKFRHTRKMHRINLDTEKPYWLRETETAQIHTEAKKSILPLNERWTFMNKYSGFESNYLQILTKYESLDKYILTTEEINTTADIIFDVENWLNLLEKLSLSDDIENIVTLTNDDGSPYMISRVDLGLKTILKYKNKLNKLVAAILNKDILQSSIIFEEPVKIILNKEMKELYDVTVQRGTELAFSMSTIKYFNNSHSQFILHKLLINRLPELWETYVTTIDIKTQASSDFKFIIDTSPTRLSRDELFIKSINNINSIFDGIVDTIEQQSSTNELSKLSRYFNELEKSVCKG